MGQGSTNKGLKGELGETGIWPSSDCTSFQLTISRLMLYFSRSSLVDSRTPRKDLHARYERSLRRENAATRYHFTVGQAGAKV